ncbi:MAG: helix-turn-helix domain-containing protein [Rhodocyclaceae bacterium]
MAAMYEECSRQDWHPADILAALHKKGITLRSLALRYGLSDSSTLSKAMLHSYPASERRLAEAAGIPVHVMFAARYYPDGEPMPRGVRGLKSNAVDCHFNGNDQKTA